MNYQPTVSTDQKPLKFPRLLVRRTYVRKRLKELGLDWIELQRQEAQHLPHVLHEGERIGGAIAGRSERGHIMLVATDRRVIVLDCKPMFKDAEDITYFVVAGVTIGSVGPLYTITLHTRLGNFTVKTIYAKAARNFKDYIDQRCIEQKEDLARYD